MKRRVIRLVISVFIFFHLSAVVLCSFPGASQTRRKLSAYFYPYLHFFNLEQNWAMFAPDPYANNSFIRAEIRYADGTTSWISTPRMIELEKTERYLLERYRKWSDDCIRTDAYSNYWPLAARYFARKAHTTTANPPVEVSLWRFWTPIANPAEKFEPVGYRVPESKMERFRYFTMMIAPEDLL